MSLKIKLSKAVVKFLDSKPPEFIRKLDEILTHISESPHTDRFDIKKLKGMDSNYRLRVGKYRFLFTVLKEDNIILIYKADTRGDVYK